jgi:hypothetical protein
VCVGDKDGDTVEDAKDACPLKKMIWSSFEDFRQSQIVHLRLPHHKQPDWEVSDEVCLIKLAALH